MAILAWGTTFRRYQDRFSDTLATRYKKPVRDLLALRRNAYCVLLPRGRDGTVIFVPDVGDLENTFVWLIGLGCSFLLPPSSNCNCRPT